jgi:hypothetical protein
MLDFNNLQGVSSKKQVKLFVTRHLPELCGKTLLIDVEKYKCNCLSQGVPTSRDTL